MIEQNVKYEVLRFCSLLPPYFTFVFQIGLHRENVVDHHPNCIRWLS